MKRIMVGAVAVLALSGALVACSDDKTATPTTSSSTTPITGQVTLLAAASLTDVFDALAADFEAANPGVDVVGSYDSSATLAAQITAGAPADVFASADEATMKTVTDAGRNDGTPTVFVTNNLVIAVAKGNPKGIASLADLEKPDLVVALCNEEAPCGRASKAAIDAAGLHVDVDTYAENVRAVRELVANGSADVGLIYRTDVPAEPRIESVQFPEAPLQKYPIVVLTDAPNKPAAEAFVAYVLSDTGRAKLDEFGFGRP